MRRPSGSSIHRAIKCPASMSLSQVTDADQDETPSRRGTKAHAYLEDVANCRGAGFTVDEARESCLERVDDDLRPFCEAIDLAALPVDLAPEVAIAWDWKARTAREIGRGLDRNYERDQPLGPTEIAMTVDVLGVDRDARRVKVSDYKTGSTRYPRPDKYGQTLLGGLAAAVLFDAEEAELELIYVDRDGLAWPARSTIDRWDLEAFGDLVERSMLAGAEVAAQLALGVQPSVTIGAHCAYCPSRTVCPGQTALIRALPAEITGLLEAGLPVQHAHYARSYLAVEQWQRALGEIERQIHAAAWVEPIDLGDGRMLGRVESERETMDGAAAVALATRWYGVEAGKMIAKITTSIEAVKGMLRAYKGKADRIESKKGDGLLDRFRDELRRTGAMKASASETIRTYKLKKGTDQ